MKTSQITVNNIDRGSTINGQTIFHITFKNWEGKKIVQSMECYNEPTEYECLLFLLSDSLGQHESCYNQYKRGMMQCFDDYGQDYVDEFGENEDISSMLITFFGFTELVNLGKELGW